MKRLLALTLAAMLVVSMSACSVGNSASRIIEVANFYVEIMIEGSHAHLQDMAPQEFWDSDSIHLRPSENGPWQECTCAEYYEWLAITYHRELEEEYGRMDATFEVKKIKDMPGRDLEDITESLEDRYGIHHSRVGRGYKVTFSYELNGSLKSTSDKVKLTFIEIDDEIYWVEYIDSDEEYATFPVCGLLEGR